MSQKKRTATKTAKVFLDKIQNSVYATGMVQIPLFILKNVGSIEVLSPEQEKQITEKIAKENCEESKNKLFNSNLKLALKISREKTFQDSYAEDVFNEACIGLWEAVSKYDASKGFRFSTYAAFLMRSSLDKNFESSNDFYDSFSQHQEEDFNLSDLQQQIKKSFSELTEKEQLVVSKRFGLDGGDELIYSQIGRMLNLTKQRIEQINKSALDKVRKSFINNGVKSLEYI
jgi:RNA polymerase sigma factor (sigma-70 family)